MQVHANTTHGRTSVGFGAVIYTLYNLKEKSLDFSELKKQVAEKIRANDAEVESLIEELQKEGLVRLETTSCILTQDGIDLAEKEDQRAKEAFEKIRKINEELQRSVLIDFYVNHIINESPEIPDTPSEREKIRKKILEKLNDEYLKISK